VYTQRFLVVLIFGCCSVHTVQFLRRCGRWSRNQELAEDSAPDSVAGAGEL